jgi:FMN phosphatase YigB (HAD superfamily)
MIVSRKELRKHPRNGGKSSAHRSDRLKVPYDTNLAHGEWVLDYPFANLLYPGALETVRHARQLGIAAMASDGDTVFQPRKIDQLGPWPAFADNVLISTNGKSWGP